MTDQPQPPTPPPAGKRLDARTIEMLVCPLTKTRLSLSADGRELISVVARLAFPIRDGVPMLALDEAREINPYDPDERTRLGIR